MIHNLLLVIIIIILQSILLISIRKNKEQFKNNYFFNLKLADTPKKRKDGYMFKKTPIKKYTKNNKTYYKGILFQYDNYVNNPFWMKNTYLSLDIIFLDHNYNIVDYAKKTKPLSLKSISSKKKYIKAIEIAGGIIDKLGIRIGENIRDKIILE